MSQTSQPNGVRIESVTPELLDRTWQLRLRALREHPEAFGSSYAESAARTDADVREMFEAFWNFRDNRTFVAVTSDGDVVGMVGFARLYREKMQHRADILAMNVVPELRGQGIADALVQAAIAYGRDTLGLLQVHLEVISTNTAAVRFYRRMGFVRHGRMPRADILDGKNLDSDQMVLIFDNYPPTGTAPPQS